MRHAITFNPRLYFQGRRLAVFLLSLCLAIPVLAISLSWFYLFDTSWGGFSLNFLFNLLSSTLFLGLVVGVGVSLLGCSLAYLVVMVDFPGRRWLRWALFLPFSVPAYVTGLAYLGLFDYAGIFQSFLRQWVGFGGVDVRGNSGMVAVVFVLAYYPYVYALAYGAFARQKQDIIASSRLLGAGPFRVFFSVCLPLARPAIAAGALISVMEVMADYGTVILFNYDTLTTAIYSAWVDYRSLEMAVKLSSLLVFIAFLLIFFEKKARGRARFYAGRYQVSPPYVANRFWRYVFSFCVFSVFFLAFILPFGQLFWWLWKAFLDQELFFNWRHLYSTFILVLLTTSAVLGFSLLFVLPRSFINLGSLTRGLQRLATLGYALPGSVMAIGLIYVTSWLTSIIGENFFGWSFDGFVYSTIVFLIWAYICRFLAIGVSSVETGIAQLGPFVVPSARLLGGSWWGIARRVQLPLLLPNLLAGAALVALDVMKELPATYLLRPFGWDTLAISVFEYSAEGLYGAAALPAVMMITGGLLLMLVVFFLQKRAYSMSLDE